MDKKKYFKIKYRQQEERHVDGHVHESFDNLLDNRGVRRKRNQQYQGPERIIVASTIPVVQEPYGNRMIPKCLTLDHFPCFDST